jgi:hypothetical protein
VVKRKKEKGKRKKGKGKREKGKAKGKRERQRGQAEFSSYPKTSRSVARHYANHSKKCQFFGLFGRRQLCKVELNTLQERPCFI